MEERRTFEGIRQEEKKERKKERKKKKKKKKGMGTWRLDHSILQIKTSNSDAWRVETFKSESKRCKRKGKVALIKGYNDARLSCELSGERNLNTRK